MTRLGCLANDFWLALAYFSRLPVPSGTVYSPEAQQRAIGYFSLIGWLLGGIQALALWGACQIWPQPVAVLLAMVLGLLLTGALHEDGLSDMCDGLGGGLDPASKLAIMKDSRLGTYGALALVTSLLLKAGLLVSLAAPWWALLLAQPLSRVLAGSLMFVLPYVRVESAKAGAVVGKSSRWQRLGLWAGGALALWLLPWPLALACILLLGLLFVWLVRFFTRHLGGYTGDCLGGAQQLAELLIYLLLATQLPGGVTWPM
ncbi:adenosylcobinamide-GDP ribazoletransferase [Pseudaeromonas paramecii]|uniref:Adenosylcobinamide-GDP ribazoletransferase n=1 Tax=Pseudaeromonas paramecii TaxID=2138166 RepID=A0ABP8PXP9_9GAMM